MAKKANQFKSLRELQKYIDNNVPTNISRSSKMERALGGHMKQAVYNEVYMGFKPKDLNSRRWARGGGMGDERNMKITDMKLDNSNLEITFENLTQGRDSMSGEYLTDMFEEGIRENWDNPDAKDKYGRTVSDPRPFIKPTIDLIEGNNELVMNAFKKSLTDAGFKVK